MDEVFTESIPSGASSGTATVKTFSVTALLLAAIGTLVVLAYMVRKRRQEIGISAGTGAGRSESALVDIVIEGLKATHRRACFAGNGAPLPSEPPDRFRWRRCRGPGRDGHSLWHSGDDSRDRQGVALFFSGQGRESRLDPRTLVLRWSSTFVPLSAIFQKTKCV